MKVEVFTPKGRIELDLTKSKDVEVFGGQEAVDYYISKQFSLDDKFIEMEKRIRTLEKLIKENELLVDFK